MSLFPLSRIKENADQAKERNDIRLAQYKEVLKRYKQSLEEYTQRLRQLESQPEGSQICHVQTSMQLSQIQNQNEEILIILDDLKQKGGDWSQAQNEEVLSLGRKTVDQIENLMTTIIETNYKLEDMDKRVMNSMSSIISEFYNQLIYQIREENEIIRDSHIKLEKKVRGNRGFLWILFFLQLIGLGGLTFIILYLMDFIL